MISVYTYGWIKLENNVTPVTIEDKTPVTIIIPAKNEEANIIKMLNCIRNQSYDRSLIEVIVADDNSKDNTIKNAQSFLKLINLKIIQLSSASGKKQAITEGVKNASNNLIVTTDADCIAGNNWIKSIVNYYNAHKPKMIIGPVSYIKNDSVFKKLQLVEFLSLIGATAGSCGINKPILCNGANLVYEKSAFNAVSGYDNNLNIFSGDDIFLLEKFSRSFPDKIDFLKNKDAIVYTEAKSSLKEFIYQRKRWASKAIFYNTFRLKFVSILVYSFNLMLLITGLFGIFNIKYFYYFLAIIFFRILFEIKLMADILKFTGNKTYIKYFIPLQIPYIFYVVLIPIAGIFGKHKWK